MRYKFLVSEWLYRALLDLYPKEFRTVYSQQMCLTFRDACRVAYHRNGAGGLLALWIPTFLDLFKSALEERARQGELTMSKARLMALAGPLTILVGAMWGMASIGEMAILIRPANADTFWDFFYLFPVIISLIPMLFALIGTRLRYYPAAGIPGRLGLALSVAGTAGMIGFVLAIILLSVMAPDVTQGSWLEYGLAICFSSFMLGFILFGVDALRYRLLPRWNLLPVVVGAAALLRFAPDWLGVRNYDPMQLAAYFLHFAITGACWVLLGVAMMNQRRETQPTAAI